MADRPRYFAYVVFRVRAWLAERIAPPDGADTKVIIDAGRPTRERPPAVEWTALDAPYDAELRYQDQDGVVSERRIRVLAEGRRIDRGGTTIGYMKAVDYSDGRRTKTFRTDRIESLVPQRR